jgi:hypothetical protein
MDRQQVHEKLNRLRGELDQLELPDSNQREVLRKVVSEIQEMLTLVEEGTEQRGGLTQRLKEVVTQIEASHPEATLRMRQVIDELAYMGI